MSDINFDLLRGSEVGLPPDGIHTADLIVAKVVDLESGSKLVTEWGNPETNYYWTSWNAFAANRIVFTQELLDGLGVDRAKITDDSELAVELERVQGQTYQVRTSAWSGGINTYIEGRQQSLDDLGTDTEGLPEVGQAPTQPTLDDSPVPF